METRISGYFVDKFGTLRNALGCCPECLERGWQADHRNCIVIAELKREWEKGKIFPHPYTYGWYWSILRKG